MDSTLISLNDQKGTSSSTQSAHLVSQSPADDAMVTQWLHGRSEHTIRNYGRDIAEFRAFVMADFRSVTLSTLQAWADSPDMAAKAASSRGRAIAAVKSLFSFAHRSGYLPFNVAALLKSPKAENKLAERILEEAQVSRILALETNPRNAVMLRLLYAAGIRVSELCGLRWSNVQTRSEGRGQVTVFGKGGKTRAIVLRSSVYAALLSIRPKGADPDDPVFKSRQADGTAGGKMPRAIDPSQVLRIVRAAARRAGIEGEVSPHWFRHAHASHSLDNGAPISLVQATLGHASLAATGRYTHARPTESSERYLKA